MTKLVAILNITPDSFSDGGRFNNTEDIIKATNQLIADGSNVIDIGAESTRPNAKILSAEEEWQRLEPVLGKIISISHENNVSVSLDTRHAINARKAIELGADWINDVSGFDADMINATTNSNAKCVLMHSLTVPADKNIIMSEDADAVSELIKWAEENIKRLEDSGISKNRIIFDPGLGFGKDAKQSWDILNNIEKFKILDVPLFIGHSRKSFFGGDMSDRDAKTLDLSKILASKNVDYLRVHDIADHVKFLQEDICR